MRASRKQRQSRTLTSTAAVLAGLTALSLGLTIPASGEPGDPPPSGTGFSFQGEHDDAAGNHDARTGSVEPTADQRAAAEALGATRVTWNDLGTPAVLI